MKASIELLQKYLDSKRITSENIGEIRAECMLPFDCEWNSLVRDETAKREENQPLETSMALGPLGLRAKVGDVIRIRYGNGFYCWKITGSHNGSLGTENLITLRRLDMKPGSAHGKTVIETAVPMELLFSYDGLELLTQ